MERWRKIKGFNYLISDNGNVKAVRTGNILNFYDCNGYNKVDLYLNSKRSKLFVHQLVCKHYHAKSYFEGAIVNHKDGNRKNNFYKNVEWSTYSLNNKHAYDVLGRICVRQKGSKSIHAKPILQYTLTGKLVARFGSIVEAQEKYGQSIERCLSGMNKTSFGFKWVYE